MVPAAIVIPGQLRKAQQPYLTTRCTLFGKCIGYTLFGKWGCDRIDACKLHDLIRDISIAKSMEENLVFWLEDGCSSNTHGRVCHLAISNNWEGDERELESTVELSHIRSLTVFGTWKPFYISNKMRFLRVLDLEETKGLRNRHIKNIGKHLHLRYLSLRKCYNITYLPDSVGNLSQLETLDIRGTRILVLSKAITKLNKLRYLHTDTTDGVKVPRGIRKLKTLDTLWCVNIARGNVVVQEIKGITSMRKLGVCHINTKNGPEFCSAISSLNHLESLAVESDEADLYDCLHTMSSPPETLNNLKLRGSMKKLPEWIKELQNLKKLKLGGTKLSGDGETMQVLGNLPNLSLLGLSESSLVGGSTTFRGGLFRSLVAAEFQYMHVEMKSLDFEATSMPKLEVLSLRLVDCTTGFSGLEFLPSIKEVRLFVLFPIQENVTKEEAEKEAKRREDEVNEDIEKQLARNQNRPILKLG